MVSVVVDSSCLIHLQKIGQHELLRGLFGKVAIPRAVAHEIQRTFPQLPQWIEVHDLSQPIPEPIAHRALGAGESETMALALERKIAQVILDDLDARNFARTLGLNVAGTGAVLYRAKKNGLIAEVRPLLDAHLAGGFRLSPKVYEQILKDAGEA